MKLAEDTVVNPQCKVVIRETRRLMRSSNGHRSHFRSIASKKPTP